MSIAGTIRSLTYLTREAYLAAASLLRGPGLPGYDDDADLLAEREAAVDVSEPFEDHSGYYTEPTCGVQFGGRGDKHACYRDPQHTDKGRDDDKHACLCGTSWGGEEPQGDCGLGVPGDIAHLYADEPPVPVPPSWFKSTPESEALLAQERVLVAAQETCAAVEALIVIAEDIRNLLHPHAPVASASPQTPADATGSDPTLANDPASVQRRHMRRLLGEDQGRP